jgi:hypothetical protein
MMSSLSPPLSTTFPYLLCFELKPDLELRQRRAYHGYELLLRHIPGLKTKLSEQDVPELNAYFRDVSSGVPLIASR